MLEMSRIQLNIVKIPEMIGSDFACLFRTWCLEKIPPIVVVGYHWSDKKV